MARITPRWTQFLGGPRRGAHSVKLKHFHPLVQTLEMRLNLSSPTGYTVNSLLDDGSAGTLRWAVGQADANPGDDTITFDPTLTEAGPATIHLKSPLSLTDATANVTISGPGANLLTVTTDGHSNVVQVGSGASCDLSGLTIANGLGDTGGGIANQGTLTVTAATFVNDSAAGGGAIYNGGGTLTVAASTFDGNFATGGLGGGGLLNSRGQVAIIDCTFSGNSASFNGGGVCANGGSTSLANSTLVGNRAGASPTGFGRGGGVFVQLGTASLNNTLVAGNSFGVSGPVASPDDVGLGPNASLDPTSSFNLIGDANTSGRLTDKSQDAADGNIVGNQGTGTIAISTVVDTTLKDNGGPTQTLALTPNSFALDAGNPTFAPPPDSDQRGLGYPRVQGGRIDIGAYESGLPGQVGDVHLDPASGGPEGTLTRSITPVIDGTVGPGTFGAMSISIFDTTDPGQPPIPVGVGTVDQLGHFSIPVSTGASNTQVLYKADGSTDGTRHLTVQAINVNNRVVSSDFTFTLNTSLLVHEESLGLDPNMPATQAEAIPVNRAFRERLRTG